MIDTFYYIIRFTKYKWLISYYFLGGSSQFLIFQLLNNNLLAIFRKNMYSIYPGIHYIIIIHHTCLVSKMMFNFSILDMTTCNAYYAYIVISLYIK